MKNDINPRRLEATDVRIGKTHISKSKTLRDCPNMSSLTLSSPMDTYDIQDIENYCKKWGFSVHHDSSCEEKKTLVWTYDRANDEFICRDYQTFRKDWNCKGLLVTQHLNNIRRQKESA